MKFQIVGLGLGFILDFSSWRQLSILEGPEIKIILTREDPSLLALRALHRPETSNMSPNYNGSNKGAEYDLVGNLVHYFVLDPNQHILFQDETCAVYPLDSCAKVHILIVPKSRQISIDKTRKIWIGKI